MTAPRTGSARRSACSGPLTFCRAMPPNVTRYIFFMSASGATASEAADSLFGFALRPPQQQTAEAVIEGRDALAVLPTGSGKSAIYQVAGIVLGGLAVVVSPLIALQRDQLRALTGRRYRGRA